jgi:hypothetical protein
MDAFSYVPGPWYGATSAMKYTGLPADGAGTPNPALWPAGTGVPLAASRAHELAGLVTPGNAVNEKFCVVAPVSWMDPLKVMRPEMAFPFVVVLVSPTAGLTLPDEEEAAGEDTDLLKLAEGLPPADVPPDELQAARTPTSRRVATRHPATAARRIKGTAGT